MKEIDSSENVVAGGMLGAELDCADVRGDK
jgi:hypothetical protein